MKRTGSITGGSRHWSEFIEFLTVRRVKFVVVGAHALAVLGVPRNTGDLDVFIYPSRANVERLREALDDFGFLVSDEIYELASGNKMITLGREPHAIQVLNAISGVSFEEVWKTRLRKKVGGRTVNFIGRDAFVKNKLAAGRAKDFADIETLKRTKSHRSR